MSRGTAKGGGGDRASLYQRDHRPDHRPSADHTAGALYPSIAGILKDFTLFINEIGAAARAAALRPSMRRGARIGLTATTEGNRDPHQRGTTPNGHSAPLMASAPTISITREPTAERLLIRYAGPVCAPSAGLRTEGDADFSKSRCAWLAWNKLPCAWTTGVACGQVHGLPTKCAAYCAGDDVAAKSAIVKAFSSAAAADVESDLTSDVGSKSTGASRHPKLPSTAVARRSLSRPVSAHLMRDGEQRHSFEMTGSTDTLSPRETTHTPRSSGRPGSQSPATRQLWYSSPASEEDSFGSNRPITSEPPASSMSASCEDEAESPTFALSKAGRRTSRENSREKTPGAAGVAEDPAASAGPLSDPFSIRISRGGIGHPDCRELFDEDRLGL